MDPILVLKPTLEAQFNKALQEYRVIFISAPCGFGKTATTRMLLHGRETLWLNAEVPSQLSAVDHDGWEILVLDNLC